MSIIIDPFKDSLDASAPAQSAAAITPNDTTDLTDPVRALYVGGAGNIHVLMYLGGDVTFSNVPAGTVLPIRVRRVYSTSTTATTIIGLW